MTFIKRQWDDNDPVDALSAANLNDLEGRIDQLDLSKLDSSALNNIAIPKGADLAPLRPWAGPRVEPGTKLAGGNVFPRSAGTGCWGILWNEWDWAGLIKPQIDLIADAGGNCIRIIGDLKIVTDGTLPLATYLDRFSQYAKYCASRGLYVYATGGDLTHCVGVPQASLRAVLVALGERLERHPNVTAYDVIQEIDIAWDAYGITGDSAKRAFLETTSDAVRAVTSVPLSYSMAHYGFQSPTLPLTDKATDFTDFHYYNTIDQAEITAYFARTDLVKKVILFGEYGAGNSDTTAVQTAKMTQMNVAVQREGVAGALIWAIIDPYNELGLWSNATPRVFHPVKGPLWKQLTKSKFELVPKAATTPTVKARGIDLFGDSILFADNNFTSGTTTTNFAYGIFHQINILLRQSLTLNLNLGIQSNTTTQMLARIGDLLASPAPYVLFMGGTNDIQQSSGTYEQIIANYEAIYAACIAAGKTVFHGTNFPSLDFNTTAKKLLHAKLNRWIQTQGPRAGVVVLPWHHALTDVATGNPRTSEGGTTVLYDNTHPAGLGAMLAAKDAAPIIASVVPAATQGRLPASNIDPLCLAGNPLWVGTGGSLGSANSSGQLANGWSAETNASSQSSIALSKVYRSDGHGQWQQIKATGLSALSSNNQAIITYTEPLAVENVGKSLEVSLEVETDLYDFYSCADFQVVIYLLNSSYTILKSLQTLSSTNSTTDVGKIPFSGVVTIDPFVVPTGTTMIQRRVAIRARQGETCTIKLGRFGIYAV